VELKNRHAFITGATSGIGRAVASALAAQGCHLVLTGRREDRLATIAKELGQQTKVLTLNFDVRDRRAGAALLEKHSGHLKSVDILVNNAGLAMGTDKVFEAKDEDFDTMIDTNIRALLWITRWFVPGFVARGSGDVINLGSVAGRWVYPGGGIYCATKHAVRAISEGLRMDLLGTGVRVMNIEPGLVETEFSEVRLKDKTRAKTVYKDTRPLMAEDIANAILWTLTQPRHVNIQELVIFPTDQAAVGQVYRRPSAE
jgi:NADP-dependent 3-hydroxy acid dehydrogenase YdfG